MQGCYMVSKPLEMCGAIAISGSSQDGLLIMTLPNYITVARFIMVPLIVLSMIDGEMLVALTLFILAGVSDAADGMIARHFNQKSELGAWLDPVADKFLLVSVFVMLGWLEALPAWLVVVAVTRDGMIISAVLLSSLLENPVEMRPLMISKANTMLQIVLLIIVLADLAGIVRLDAVIGWMIYGVAGLTVASTGAYLVSWLRHMTSEGGTG
ncbi:MAG: CDP-alcohol phosphatidyltransferase family protein [Hoeflea sp.]|uniref:CDP-alcohol phosphatidyltransferase family protein n=1 Tax=Hoeflea sp. TaxID=1940281 RepID=UPI003299C51B